MVYLEHTLGKHATIHQVNTMLATSKNVLFPGHNHLLTTGTDDLTLWLSPERLMDCGFYAQLYMLHNDIKLLASLFVIV